MTIIQHTLTACAGPQAGIWHHMLALLCWEGMPLVVDEGGDEGVVVIWLQFGPLHLSNAYTQACTPTRAFVSFISILILGWWPPVSSWILIAIWLMWRGPQGVGWVVTTYARHTHTHTENNTLQENTAGHGSVNYSLQKPFSVLTLNLLSVPCSPCLTDAVMILAVTDLSVNSLLC